MAMNTALTSHMLTSYILGPVNVDAKIKKGSSEERLACCPSSEDGRGRSRKLDLSQRINCRYYSHLFSDFDLFSG